jgi:hypothetical protein
MSSQQFQYTKNTFTQNDPDNPNSNKQLVYFILIKVGKYITRATIKQLFASEIIKNKWNRTIKHK